MTVAQSQLSELSGAPVDIHEGTCDDFLAEPAYDDGDLETAVLDDVVDVDEWLDFGLFEDDELGAYGVDLDEDDALADNEIIGGGE